jgi:hypothetical protein
MPANGYLPVHYHLVGNGTYFKHRELPILGNAVGMCYESCSVPRPFLAGKGVLCDGTREASVEAKTSTESFAGVRSRWCVFGGGG